MPEFLQDSGIPPYWTGYVHTNLQFAVDTIPDIGGTLFTMPTKSAMGTSVVFTDAGGAMLAAYELSDSFSIPSSVHDSEFVWQRLYSADNGKSANFYSALFNWTVSKGSEQSMIFHDRSKNVLADMVSKPSWLDTDTWVYFLSVGDISKTISVIGFVQQN